MILIDVRGLVVDSKESDATAVLDATSLNEGADGDDEVLTDEEPLADGVVEDTALKDTGALTDGTDGDGAELEVTLTLADAKDTIVLADAAVLADAHDADVLADA